MLILSHDLVDSGTRESICIMIDLFCYQDQNKNCKIVITVLSYSKKTSNHKMMFDDNNDGWF